MMGILNITFAKIDLKERINNVEHDSVKLNTMKGKGAVVIRFSVDKSNISFVNCHLTSGTKDF